MENGKGYGGPERRAHPRFQLKLPAFLKLPVMKEGNISVLELKSETINISLEGVRLSIPGQAEVVSYSKNARESREMDVGVEIVTEEKRIKAVGDVRWFIIEASKQVSVGIHLKEIGREDRKIWEHMPKSLGLSQ